MASSRAKDMTGKRFYNLVVIKRAENKVYPSGGVSACWLCKCDCGNEVIVAGDSLRRGLTKSCGCLRDKYYNTKRRKTNDYNLSGEYGIGYTSNGEEFYFDLEDYDKIKDYSWHLQGDGYIGTHISGGKQLRMHRLLIPSEQKIDHINHCLVDNRKSNLRVATTSQNGMNRTINRNNKSGITGVCYNKQTNKYVATMKYNLKDIFIGSYQGFTNASLARLETEEKYYKEFMPQDHRKILSYIRNGGKLEYGNKELVNKIINDML